MASSVASSVVSGNCFGVAFLQGAASSDEFSFEFFPVIFDYFSSAVETLTGKFYARHDFPDPKLVDPQLEQEILNKKSVLPKNRFKEPLTSNMEYGWYEEQRIDRSPFNFRFPKRTNPVTRIGELIAVEDQKMPKKPFTGVAFKV